jgi:hypothetical protein
MFPTSPIGVKVRLATLLHFDNAEIVESWFDALKYDKNGLHGSLVKSAEEPYP